MQALRQRLSAFKNHTALISANGAVSYADLLEAMAAFQQKLPPFRHLLAIETANEPEAAIAYLAGLDAGHVVMPLPAGTFNQHADVYGQYKPGTIYRKTGNTWQLECTGDDPFPMHRDLALLLSTSGSTGSPKLVKLTRENLESNARSIAAFLGLSATERAITTLPLHYSYGLSVLNSHCYVGASLVLTEHSVLDKEFWQAFGQNQCTSLAGVPHTFQLLDSSNFVQRDLPSLHYVTQAGGRLKPELVSRFSAALGRRKVRFYVMYGQTEATARMAYLPPEHLEHYPDCIGVAIPDGAFRLIDDKGQIITRDQTPGELVYEGPNVMMGYAESGPDLAKGRELTALHTGDIAVRNEAGLYKIVGRKNRFIKPFGLRIALDEVERILEAQGFDAVATGDDAQLVIATLDTAATAAIQTFLAEKLSLPATAIAVCPYNAYPLLPSGKLAYKNILDRAVQQPQDDPLTTRRSDGVLDIYRTVFGSRALSQDDSFVSLAGDSLIYVTLTTRLEEYLGYLPDHWPEQTIGQLESLPRHQRQTAVVDTESLFRVLTIIGVVVTHAKLALLHGAALLLLLLAGYNFARFQSGHLLNGEPHKILGPIIKHIMLPYYAIVLAFLVYQQDFYWPLLLLISNFFGGYQGHASFMAPYWFLEAFFQIILVFCIIFLPKTVRRSARPHLFIAWSALFICFLSLRLAVPLIWDAPHLDIRVPHMLLYAFCFGGLIHLAQSRQRQWLVSGLACVVFPLLVDEGKAAVYIGVTLVLVWFPVINLYSFAARKWVSSIAQGSFYIYLLHSFPVYFIVLAEPANETLYAQLLAIVVSLLIGPLIVRFIKPAGSR